MFLGMIDCMEEQSSIHDTCYQFSSTTSSLITKETKRMESQIQLINLCIIMLTLDEKPG